MRWMKHCPKCGSTNISPLAFYLPSTWRCLDCGYEGAFIVEGNILAAEIQEHRRSGNNSIFRAEGLGVGDWDYSTHLWQRL